MAYTRLDRYEERDVALTILGAAPTANGGQTAALLADYAGGALAAHSAQIALDSLELAATLAQGHVLAPGARFTLGGIEHVGTATGQIVRDVDAASGAGTVAGAVDAALGRLRLTAWPAGAAPVVAQWAAVQAPALSGLGTPLLVDSVVFRTAVAPIRPGSFSVVGAWADGTAFNAQADSAGVIDSGGDPSGSMAGSPGVYGRIDYESGVVELRFGRQVAADTPLAVGNVTTIAPTGAETQSGPTASPVGVADVTDLGVPGVARLRGDGARADSLRYNAAAYTYLPLDADLLGIDPVRLPSDGRVPIFRPGSFAVVGHTARRTQTVANGQTVNLARVRLSRVRVLGADGVAIQTGFSVDLEAGSVSFSNVAGYAQPVTIEDRIEDMVLVRDAQISGQLTFTRPITHAYPAGAHVSSALVAGDLQARVGALFDQATWTGAWDEVPAGNAATGTFNAALAPIVVTNRGAVTERWAVRFTNTTAFEVIGEHVGVIAQGNTATDCAPLNPATGTPYFQIPALGWGLGWSPGNVLRFDTVGALFPVWIARTIQQGPESVQDDVFSLNVRGDVDRP